MVTKSPKDWVVRDPFQMAEKMAEINGGDPNHVSKSWDDPPSTPSIHPVGLRAAKLKTVLIKVITLRSVEGSPVKPTTPPQQTYKTTETK